MRILAPAKINLYLDIVGVRSDGYHELETIFQTVNLYDSLEIQKAKPPIALKVSLPGNLDISGLEGPQNIVWKAADRFFKKLKISGACKIAIKKNIPIQAGLGGGSSDGAAVLKALKKIFLKKSGAPQERVLEQAAASLGADVPFFLKGGCAFGEGAGEKLSSLPVPKFWAVLVKPKIGLSTREVYGWYDARPPQKPLTGNHKIRKMIGLIRLRKSSRDWSDLIYNCFEDVVYSRVPELGRLKRILLAQGARNALLSGSGSALFGLADSKVQGEKIKRAMVRMGLEAWVVRSV